MPKTFQEIEAERIAADLVRIEEARAAERLRKGPAAFLADEDR